MGEKTFQLQTLWVKVRQNSFVQTCYSWIICLLLHERGENN